MLTQSLSHHIRDIAIFIIATVGGWLYVLYFQTTWTNPVIISAIVAGLFLLLSKAYDTWMVRRDKQREKHVTYSERVQELTQEGWQEYVKELKELHQREITFYQEQLTIANAEIKRLTGAPEKKLK
jgi:protease II